MSIENTLKNEHKSVRDWFDRLTDDMINDDKAFALEFDLEENHEKHQAANADFDTMRQVLERQRATIDLANGEIAAIEMDLPQAIAGSILAGKGVSGGDALLVRKAKLGTQISAIELALPALVSRLEEIQRTVEREAHFLVDSQVELANHRYSLRLNEARRRAAA